jgi:pimeloyl-ACP methyl ester carboxylesterase
VPRGLAPKVAAAVVATLVGVAAALVGRELIEEERDHARLVSPAEVALLGGARIRYRFEGRGRPGPAILFVGGLGASLEQWADAQTQLQSSVPTLAYDRGGQGLSRGSRAWDGAAQADEAVALLDALGLRDPVVVVGYSTGASTARLLAARSSSRVAALILLSPYTPEIEGLIPGRHSHFRRFAKQMVQLFLLDALGVSRRREQAALSARTAGRVATPIELRTTAVLSSVHHRYAVVRDWLASDATARELREHPLPRTVPVWVLAEPEPAALRSTPALLHALVAAQSRGGVQFLDVNHDEINRDPRAIAALLAARAAALATP